MDQEMRSRNCGRRGRRRERDRPCACARARPCPSPTPRAAGGSEVPGRVTFAAKEQNYSVIVTTYLQYYQTADAVTVSIMEKGVRPEEVLINFTAKTLTVKLARDGQEVSGFGK